MTRDLTKAQFDKRCVQYGFKPHGPMGYYQLAPPVANHSVSIWNAGDRRRDQLAYLIQQQNRAEKAERERRAASEEAHAESGDRTRELRTRPPAALGHLES